MPLPAIPTYTEIPTVNIGVKFNEGDRITILRNEAGGFLLIAGKTLPNSMTDLPNAPADTELKIEDAQADLDYSQAMTDIGFFDELDNFYLKFGS